MFSHGHYYFPGVILALKKRGLREEGICFLQSEEFRVLDSVNTHSCAVSGGSLSPSHHWTGTSFNMLSIYMDILYFMHVRDIHICILTDETVSSHAIF